MNNDGPARLLINQVGQDQPWLGVRVLEYGRDAIGARVGLERRGQPMTWRQVSGDGSYASASDSRVHFGLGKSSAVTGVVVRWGDGSVERFKTQDTGRYVTLRRGEGQAEKAGAKGKTP